MKHSRIFFASLSIMVLFLAACGSGSNAGGASRNPFLGGNKGLSLEFERGSPPDEIYDRGTTPFNAIVKMKNEGEFDIRKDQVKVALLGILPQDFAATPDELNDKLPADDLTSTKKNAEGDRVEGTTTFVTFPSDAEAFNFPGVLNGNQEYKLRADVCYFYQTKAVTTLCVLRDLITTDEDALCDPSTTKTVHVSGGPIGVGNLRQDVVGKDKIGFTFDITETGQGFVFKAGAADAPDAHCPKDASERRAKEDRVLVTVNTGLPGIRCSGLDGGSTGHITMVNGKRTVTCTQDVDAGRNDFEKPIEIALEYNYNDMVEKALLVKHLIE